MAYMSEPFYVYSDGVRMHIDGEGGHLTMPVAVFDELVALRWFRLDDEERLEAMHRAVTNHGGNLGSDALRLALGLPTNIAEIVEHVRHTSP